MYLLALTVNKILETPCPFLVYPVWNFVTFLMNLRTHLFGQVTDDDDDLTLRQALAMRQAR